MRRVLFCVTNRSILNIDKIILSFKQKFLQLHPFAFNNLTTVL